MQDRVADYPFSWGAVNSWNAGKFCKFLDETTAYNPDDASLEAVLKGNYPVPSPLF